MLEKAVNSEYVNNIGLSNFNTKQVDRVLAVTKNIPPAVLQSECHPYLSQVPVYR
eukprot:UN01651